MRSRFPETEPPQAWPAAHTCPYCEQPLTSEWTSIPSLFRGGVRRLWIACGMLLGAAMRGVRFALASGLCLLGCAGSFCRMLGLRIAHPDDRRFLGAGEASKSA